MIKKHVVRLRQSKQGLYPVMSMVPLLLTSLVSAMVALVDAGSMRPERTIHRIPETVNTTVI